MVMWVGHAPTAACGVSKNAAAIAALMAIHAETVFCVLQPRCTAVTNIAGHTVAHCGTAHAQALSMYKHRITHAQPRLMTVTDGTVAAEGGKPLGACVCENHQFDCSTCEFRLGSAAVPSLKAAHAGDLQSARSSWLRLQPIKWCGCQAALLYAIESWFGPDVKQSPASGATQSSTHEHRDQASGPHLTPRLRRPSCRCGGGCKEWTIRVQSPCVHLSCAGRGGSRRQRVWGGRMDLRWTASQGCEAGRQPVSTARRILWGTVQCCRAGLERVCL
jgi:hypothetical protein